MAENTHDIIVLGGGPGGYVAAIRAAQLGMKVALVEANHLGGICLNWGCIPTKALLRSSEIYHNIKNAEQFGFKVTGVQPDIKKIIKRSRDVASQLSTGVAHLMKKNKVEVIDGFGKFNAKNKITVADKSGKKIKDLQADNIIIATGATARQLPGLEADGKQILTYKEAMTLTEVPKKLLIVGSGAIGIEFASFYSTMGAKVTIVEVADRILPVEDDEISKLATKAFEGQGITIKTSTNVTSLKKAKTTIEATLESDGKKSTLKADKVIMAVGIKANVDDIRLEATNVKLDRGHISTNKWCETAEEGIYAIGDVAGPPWLAHKASHEGILCVEKIAGQNNLHPIDKTNIPGCTYCMPQIASVGLTERAAKEQGFDIKVGRFPFIGNGKAIALGESEGLIKTIFNTQTGELIGAHMIGAEVTELINGFTLGKTMEATEEDFMHTIFAHPTLSEMMHESVLDAYGKVVHM